MTCMPELDNVSRDALIARFCEATTGREGYEQKYYDEVTH